MIATGEKKFRKAQWGFIVSSAFAYMFFYVTRKNLSMAQPYMLEEGVITMIQLGTITSLHGILYGLSRFVNGFWADRLNGRIFMAVGLLLSALMNFLFGCTSLSILFAAFWIINGWTLGMGFPACAKMLAHWIHPRELATKMAIWNTSHSWGSVSILGLCSLLFYLGLGWRWCFWVPAVLAALAAVFCLLKVRETPQEAGLPPFDIGSSHACEKAASDSTAKERLKLVFGNRVIWLVACANFFIYILRFGFLDWGPTFLKQYKGIPVTKGGLMIIAFELAAVVGTVFAGWLTDRVFKGRGARTCVFCMLFAAVFVFAFYLLPASAPAWQATLLLMGAGFCIYGPQALVGIIASNQATNKAAAMANGFVGIMGYLSTTISGLGIALVQKHYGWGVALCSIAVMAVLGMVLFLFAWSANADGYKRG